MAVAANTKHFSNPHIPLTDHIPASHAWQWQPLVSERDGFVEIGVAVVP